MNAHAGAVLHHLDRLFHRGTVAGLTEGALLERYVIDRDEAAFAALVARHGPMVLGVCRRILRDDRDVEDAFQATFLVLVRRAGAIRDGDRVGCWLHGVAHRVAVRARAHAARRFVHEQSTDDPVEAVDLAPGADDVDRRELAAIVEEELSRLPSNLREPVVLCYLEGMTHDEAARRLRWPVGTVRSRMARAREVLRHRLARRGVAAEASAIAATLVRTPVPPAWIDATAGISLNFAANTATAAAALASARSVAIARRMLQTMLITKLSYLGAAGLGLALTLGGVRTLAFQAQPARPAESAPAAKPKKSAPAGPQRERSLNEVQVAAEVSEINTLIRWDQVERDLRHSADSISKLQEELVKLKAEVKESQSRYAEYQAVRRRLENPPPTPATPTPAPAPTPATPVRARPDAEAERPQYLSLGRSMVVISPDGSRASLYDLHGDKFKPLPLPPMAGVRREFLFPKHLLFPNAYRRPGQVTNPVASPWCVALELDQDRKVVKIVAVNIQDGSHAATTPPTPFPDRSSVSTPRPDIVVLGGGMVAFSSTAKKWGALSGVTSGPEFDESGTWAESKGRLYRFNRATGEWDDLYARSLQTGEGMKYDTRYAPAQ